MLSDIAHGHADGADILLLVAIILFVVAAALHWLQGKALPAFLTALGLASTALALLIL